MAGFGVTGDTTVVEIGFLSFLHHRRVFNSMLFGHAAALELEKKSVQQNVRLCGTVYEN